MSGILFAGDAVGVKLPDAGVLRPSTPPPDFDLDQALHSLERFAARRPTAPGPGPLRGDRRSAPTCSTRPPTRCGGGRSGRVCLPAGLDIADALAAAFASDLDGVPAEHREKLEVMNGVHSNAAGLHRWLATRPSGGDPAAEGP